MKKRNNLLDFYTRPFDYGIFYALSKNEKFKNIFNKISLFTEFDFHAMDMDYYYNRSGLKPVSMLLFTMINGYVVDEEEEYVKIKKNNCIMKVSWDYVLQDVDQQIIDTIITAKFLKKWSDMIDTLTKEYDFINPYNVETTSKMTDKMNSNSETINSNNREITNKNDSTSNENIFGYNTNEPSPAGQTIINSSDKSTSENRNAGIADYNRTNKVENNVVRKGNIGNKSVAQLIEEQRQMLRFQIFDILYDDLDSVLTGLKYI